MAHLSPDSCVPVLMEILSTVSSGGCAILVDAIMRNISGGCAILVDAIMRNISVKL